MRGRFLSWKMLDSREICGISETEGSRVTPRLRTVGDSRKLFLNKLMLCFVTLLRFVFEPSQMNFVLLGLSLNLDHPLYTLGWL